MMVPRGLTNTKKWGDSREKPFLYGIWEVSSFLKNGDTLAPLITDNERWQYLIIDYKNRATVKTMTAERQAYHFIIDSTKKRISVFERDADTIEKNFNYKNPNKHFLEIIF